MLGASQRNAQLVAQAKRVVDRHPGGAPPCACITVAKVVAGQDAGQQIGLGDIDGHTRCFGNFAALQEGLRPDSRQVVHQQDHPFDVFQTDRLSCWKRPLGNAFQNLLTDAPGFFDVYPGFPFNPAGDDHNLDDAGGDVLLRQIGLGQEISFFPQVVGDLGGQSLQVGKSDFFSDYIGRQCQQFAIGDQFLAAGKTETFYGYLGAAVLQRSPLYILCILLG